MAEIVNLRRVRKARKREEERAEAAVQRAAHGRTKGEREAEGKERARAERLLEGARVGSGRSGGGSPPTCPLPQADEGDP